MDFQNIPQILNSAFDTMKLEYEKIFQCMHPANGSSGFTEANQTANFVNALKVKLHDPEVIAWFEFPWKFESCYAKASGRIDALVYSPKYQTLFCIEAKRIWDETKKISIKNDIQRLEDGLREMVFNENFTFKKSEYSDKVIKDTYLIVLGDVWLSKPTPSFNKRDVPRWWLGKKYEDKIPSICSLENNSTDFLLDGNMLNWTCNLHELKTPKSDTPYCLMIAYKKYTNI